MDRAVSQPTEQFPRARRGAVLLYRLWQRLRTSQELLILLLLLALGTFFSLQSDNFLSSDNLLNLVRSFAWIAIVAFGECLVIIIGGIDLSVGAVMALAGIVSGVCLQAGLPVPLAVLGGLLSGGLIGCINGLMIGRVGLPPFIVTLGTMGVARGIALGITGGNPIRDLPAAFRVLGQGSILIGGVELPLVVIWMLTLAVVVGFVLSRTVLGRYIYTLGSNEQVLRIADVNTVQLKILVYTLSGLLTAFGGILLTARLGVAAPTAAVGYELDVIAAAVIGGVSLFGGEGSVLGVILGAAMMQTTRNGLFLLGFPSYWQVLAIGLMILIVVLLDAWRRRRVNGDQ
ncbi:MAG: ABC transporter permease [Chloroflexaceae bacterium]|nr:ABC transporter permease [Chloroflexaceae bacterium]NJL32886.1 ABC transporter permease [Chloroflexaceae bacterium]NJO05385.1 ABC transporter permease [Chloroflexaceae bacterium]